MLDKQLEDLIDKWKDEDRDKLSYSYFSDEDTLINIYQNFGKFKILRFFKLDGSWVVSLDTPETVDASYVFIYINAGVMAMRNALEGF